VHSSLATQLAAALGPGYTIERELEGGGMSRVFVAFEEALQRRVAIKVLPEHMAASLSMDRFRREILLSAGLQHPHIVGVLSAGQAAGLPFFVMPFVEGESLAGRLGQGRTLGIRESVSILKDVARALAYAHERGIVHRDIKPHNILLAGGSATVTDFGVAKALNSARRSADRNDEGTLTGTGTSLGTPLYMAPEQAAADPDVDHRADIYAFGITAYEMLTGRPPFAGLAPRAMLAARMTEDPALVESLRADVPVPLAALVRQCLEREPSARPQGAAELLAALDDPAMVSGIYAAPGRPRRGSRLLHWRGTPAAAAAAVLVLLAVGSATVAHRGTGGAVHAVAAPAPPKVASIVVLPLVNIGADSTNAYLAAGITNELAAALGRAPGLRVVSPSRAAAMLATGKTPSEIGSALAVGLQLEGTVQREGKRLRVTARLVNVSDGVMRWSDMYERDATNLLSVQDELSQAITLAVGREVNGEEAPVAVAAAGVAAAAATTDPAAYDLYLRGRFMLGKRSAASLRSAVSYFERALARDPKLAVAYSGLADAQGLLPLYTTAPAAPALAAALRSADRAIALDSSLAEVWASRGVLNARGWRWADSEHDFHRAIALNGLYAPAHQWLGELYLVTGRIPEAVHALERAAQLEPTSPVIVASLAMALSLAGRAPEAVATAERAVSYDSTSMVTRFMYGATQLYARRPAAAVSTLEEAVRLDPDSRTSLGLLGYAYAASGDTAAARRIRARVDAMPSAPGTDVAVARIAIGLGDTALALTRLERAARARDPFFSSEATTSPLFDAVRRSPRFTALMHSVGLPVTRAS
jgi:serine/threonine-protein kinase